MPTYTTLIAIFCAAVGIAALVAAVVLIFRRQRDIDAFWRAYDD